MIRLATSNDLDDILEIYNDVVKNTTAVYDYEPRTREAQLLWFENKTKENYPIFVAEKNERVVGFASYGQFRPWPAYIHTVEHAIYVSQKFSTQGIGTALLSALIEHAKKNYHSMIAGIDANNIASIKLHEKFGFVQVGYLKEVGWKFDKWLDLVFMELLLSERN